MYFDSSRHKYYIVDRSRRDGADRIFNVLSRAKQTLENGILTNGIENTEVTSEAGAVKVKEGGILFN